LIDSRPSEPERLVFDTAMRLLRFLVPSRIRQFITTLLLGTTPDVPVSLRQFPASSSAPHAFWSGVLTAFLFCFVGTLIATYFGGTLTGEDPTRIYFINDYPNLINYLIICPLYVGLSAMFATLVLQSWQRIYLTDGGFSTRVVGRRRLPLAVLIALVLGSSAVLTIQYIVECLNLAIYARAGWYVTVDAASGARSIGPVGIYYALLNFGLLSVCLLGFLFVVPYSAIAVDVGRAIRLESVTSRSDFSELRASLIEYTQSYIALKLLAVVLMLNAYTWKWEKPEGSLNFVLLAGVLSVVGVFIVSFPRYYIELEWYYFRVRRAVALGEPVPCHVDDLRGRWTRFAAYAVDLFFGVGFVLSIWS